MRARQVARPPRFCVKPCPMVQMPDSMHQLTVCLRPNDRLQHSPHENMSPLSHHCGLILLSIKLAGTSKRTYGTVKEKRATLYPLLFGRICKLFSNPSILAFAKFDRSTNETRNSRNRMGNTARSILRIKLLSKARSKTTSLSDTEANGAFPLLSAKLDASGTLEPYIGTSISEWLWSSPVEWKTFRRVRSLQKPEKWTKHFLEDPMLTKWRLTGTLVILRAFTNILLALWLRMLNDKDEGSELQLCSFPIVLTFEDKSICGPRPQRLHVARCADRTCCQART